MNDVVFLLALPVGLCLVFGVIYPAAAVLLYPAYKRLGGKLSFREYVSNI